VRIELLRVNKRFGKVRALSELTLSIPSGSRIGLVGPNGSGKSTLVRALTGLIACEGQVCLNGLDPLRDRATLASQMAYVPQIAPRLAAPVDEILTAIATVRGIEPDAVRVIARRLGMETQGIGQVPFRDLSGGMKQKLLIGLALARPTPLIILDEPTASLDADAREVFFRLFEELAGEATLLLSSHRTDELRRMVDRVVALSDGVVVYDGAASAYLNMPHAQRVPKSVPEASAALLPGGEHA
jgi:ABC-2 type transport system ATP-binding protein